HVSGGRTVGAVLVTLSLAAGIAGASQPGERCAAAKLRAAGRKSAGKLNCQAREVLRRDGSEVDCLARIESKFASAWAKIEAKGGCVVSGDADTVEGLVDQLVADLVAVIPPRRAPPSPSRHPRRAPRRRRSTARTLAARPRVLNFAPLDRPARRPATEVAGASGRPYRAAIWAAGSAPGARVPQARRVALTPTRRNARRPAGASDRLALIVSRASAPRPALPGAREARRGRSRARATSGHRRPSRPPGRRGGVRGSAGRRGPRPRRRRG